MIRKQLNDYILTGRNNPINNFSAPGVGDIGFFPITLQLIIMATGLLKKNGFDLQTDPLRDSILFLTLLFIWISQIRHPLKLSRIYYLCPMSADERSRYLRNAYLFRSLLHSLLIVIMSIVLFLLCRVSTWSLIYLLICGIMYSFLSSVHDGITDFIRSVFLKPAMFISIYAQFALPSGVLTPADRFFIIVSFLFLLLVELPMFIKLIKEVVKDIKEGALSEEEYSRC